LYATNVGTPNFIRQTLLDIRGQIGSDIIIVGDFNTRLLPIDHSEKNKSTKKTSELNCTTDPMDLADTTEYSIQLLLNTRSSQLLMKHSPKQITF
jgi:hypothetical protein